MAVGVVGRLLVASLHQGIADLLPNRLEFYESWLRPAGLGDARVGLAPLSAALSFLRREGEPYHQVAARAGQYAAEWTDAERSSLARAVVRRAPVWLRTRLVMRAARRLIGDTHEGSHVRRIRSRAGVGLDIMGSIFCGVRAPAARSLCTYYASALARLMELYGLSVQVDAVECRATGAERCRLIVQQIPGVDRG